MPDDERLTWDLIFEVLDPLKRYRRDAYDRLADQMSQAAEASAAQQRAPTTRRLPAPVRRPPPTRSADSDLAPNSPYPVHHQPASAGDGMKQPEDSEPLGAKRGRPPDYVVVISASDWVKEHFQAARANLWDALHTGHDRHRDSEPEPDLEAEP